MLVLSRRKDERIVIGGSIVITVIEVKGDKVRLGIEAPKEVSVHRQEVHAAIAEEQRLAEAEACSCVFKTVTSAAMQRLEGA